jgi:hypothetical protein
MDGEKSHFSTTVPYFRGTLLFGLYIFNLLKRVEGQSLFIIESEKTDNIDWSVFGRITNKSKQH